jgi:DNA-binding CsgD family transcriptional regulator
MPPDKAPFAMIGREAELASVREWHRHLADGPSAVLVRGEAGIGKSTLWTWIIEGARSAGANILIARPVAAELPLGYATLTDLLAEAAPSVLDDLPEPLAHALAGALLIRVEPIASQPLAVARAAAAAFRALAAGAPLIVAIDDVQWLDPASARALTFALRRLTGVQVGFAICLRDGFDDPLMLRTALGDRLLELPLQGMSVGAIGSLVRTRVDGQLRRRSVLAIHERSRGNPFVALELARSGGDTLSGALRELVGRRLDEVPTEAGPAIDLASVLGPVSKEVYGSDESLELALQSGILQTQGDEVRFSHPLLATAAYERIPAPRRRALHERAAELVSGLEAQARHRAIAADAPDPGIAALVNEAATAARRRGAPEAAAGLRAVARRLTPETDAELRIRLTMDEADDRYLAAEESAARTLVDQVLASGTRGTVRTRALVQRALVHHDPAAAVVLIKEAVAEPHDDKLLKARTMAQLAWQQGAWLGDVEGAQPPAKAAVALAETLDDDTTLVAALTSAGLVASLAGDPGAEGYFKRALKITDRNPPAAGDHTPRLAYAHQRWWRADWQTAEELMAAERRYAELHGDEGLIMRLDQFAAEFELRRGNWDAAADLLEDAIAEARDYWRVMALLRRALLRARRGDDAALDDAAEIAASPLAAAEPVVAAAADFAVGLIAAARGRSADAAELVRRLPIESDGSGSRGPEFAVIIPEAVRVLVEAGMLADAEAITRRLEARSAQFDPWGGAAVSLCRGVLELANGGSEAATFSLERARRSFEELNAPWELGQALLVEGSALRRLGRRRDAAAALDRAVAIFERLGAVPSRTQALQELRRARPRRHSDTTLTAAENRVAELVAAGSTNKEVAARLFTTVATVEAHLTRIYAKVGVRSRTELARRMADQSHGG